MSNKEPERSEAVDNSSKEPEVLLDPTVTVEKETTPIRLQLRGYFAKLLTAKKKSSLPTDKRKVKPNFYGEVLTTDDVFERRKAKRGKEKSSSTTKR